MNDYKVGDIVKFSMNTLPDMFGFVVKVDNDLVDLFCLDGKVHTVHYGEIIEKINKWEMPV